MKLLVRGGTIVTPEASVRADVLCDGGTIAGLVGSDDRVDADEVIDATGLLVFPGFIDPHVHSRDPGMTDKEDFAHSTRAAAAGGVTTLLEMPNAIPPVTNMETFRERAAAHERVASVDFGLWSLSLGRANLDQLGDLLGAGAVGVKVFWGYALDRTTNQLIYDPSGRRRDEIIPPPETGDLLAVCREVASHGGLLAAHCEDASIIRAAMAQLGREIETYDDLLAARPDVAETVSIAAGIELARYTGCRFHVVHLAAGRGAELVREARRRGVPVSAETCPHYLTLTADMYDRLGPVMKVFPPIRHAADQDALWAAIADGTITSVGSDHAPHHLEEKLAGLGPSPAGSVGVETLGPVMLDAVGRGRLSPERLAFVLSESTARMYGLFPRKGAIRPGSDADLTLVDMAASRTIRGERLHSKQRYSAWEAMTLTGLPVLSLLRGEVVMREGEPVGEARGRLVRASHRAPQVLAT